MQLMVERALHRRTFGKLIAEHGSFLSDLAKASYMLVFCSLFSFKNMCAENPFRT